MKIEVIEKHDNYNHLYVDGEHCLCDSLDEIKKFVREIMNSPIRPLTIKITRK